MEAGWNGALARLDTNSRTAAAHDLHASAGNAAVQRMLSRDDQGARRDAAGGDLQRAIEDEEMPDEAAAG